MTWQGEGPHAGRVVGFLRLGLCNLACGFCDTPYTWDRTRFDVDAECPPATVDDVAARVAALGVGTVVVSGGEPLIHQRQLLTLMDALPDIEWHIETNGTIPPTRALRERVAHWSVSPKLANNGADPVRRRIRPQALLTLVATDRAVFKFVAADPSDVEELAQLAKAFGLPPARVWVMPEGTTATNVIRTHRSIAAAALAHGFATSTRLHVLLWDDTRGV